MLIFTISSFFCWNVSKYTTIWMTKLRSQNLFMFNNHHLTDSISKAVGYAETAVQEQIGKDELPPLPTQKNKCIIPIPKMATQTRKPSNEKSILYTISMTMMHPPATIKCFGEEKTICNLQMDNNVEWTQRTFLVIESNIPKDVTKTTIYASLTWSPSKTIKVITKQEGNSFTQQQLFLPCNGPRHKK